MSSSRPQKNLATSFAIQVILILIFISLAFYVITKAQSKRLEKQLLDKAQLYSAILESNIDKLLGDNVTAFKALQSKVMSFAKTDAGVQMVQIIAPEKIILASTDQQRLWKSIQSTYENTVADVVSKKEARSILQIDQGFELVIHFLPILDMQENVLSVLQVAVPFDIRKDPLSASLRANKRAYFRTEAGAMANDLTKVLQGAFEEALRNFIYLQNLVRNIKKDEDLMRLSVYSKQWGAFLSERSLGTSQFIEADLSALQIQAIESKKSVTEQTDNITVASPLYVRYASGRTLDGALELQFSLDRLMAENRERQITMFGMNILIGCIFWLLIGVFFKRRILNPVGELSQVAERVKADDLSQRVPVGVEDELGRLAHTFNDMVEEIEHSRKASETWNERLQERVDQVTQELEEKQVQLLKSEKLASIGVLSSGIAHEINNPLGIILGETQMLRNALEKKGKAVTQDDMEEVLKHIEDQTKRCSHIVKSLLQFTRSKELNFQFLDVHHALDNAILFTKERMAHKNIEVRCTYASSLPDVYADAIQLEQVFVNLLMNAEQSMLSAGSIVISTYEKDGMIAVQVKDSGQGISDEVRNKIFDPFFTTKDPGQGVGLGLSLSYGVIKAHGGDIRIVDTSSQGTTMLVTLPQKEKV